MGFQAVNEIERLKLMWAYSPRRTTDLIVSATVLLNKSEPGERDEWVFKNDEWAFLVPFWFRDALDIKYDQRVKEKRPYMVWTQGPVIHFKEGDLIRARSGDRFVQVSAATPMGWNKAKGVMAQGGVTYSEFSTLGGRLVKTGTYDCTQMQFLQMLMSGEGCVVK